MIARSASVDFHSPPESMGAFPSVKNDIYHSPIPKTERKEYLDSMANNKAVVYTSPAHDDLPLSQNELPVDSQLPRLAYRISGIQTSVTEERAALMGPSKITEVYAANDAWRKPIPVSCHLRSTPKKANNDNMNFARTQASTFRILIITLIITLCLTGGAYSQQLVLRNDMKVQLHGRTIRQKPSGEHALNRYSIIASNEFTSLEKKKLYTMYRRSYAKLGLQYNERNYEEIFEKYPCGIYMYDGDRNIMGVIMYWQTDYGNKFSLTFGPKMQMMVKTSTFPVRVELLQREGWYAEVSGAVEHILRKYYRLDNIRDRQFVVDIVNSIVGIGKLDISDVANQDDPVNHVVQGEYRRNINGLSTTRKVIFGSPCPNSKLLEYKGCLVSCRDP